MALLHVLSRQKPNRLVALTVDHGLRDDSAAEARQVAQYCQSQGIEHHIMCWADTKPQTGVQTKARTARRQLLIDQCKQLDITDLYLAHQADDQIETFLQRLSRGSGPQGLQGMRIHTTQQGVTLHRPFLDVRRSDLRAYCVHNTIPFVDDPSNDDPRFERVRWRRMIDTIEQQQPGFATGVLRSQTRLAAAAQAITVIAQQWLAAHALSDQATVTLPRASLATQPHAVIVAILRERMTTDKAYGVDLERLEDWVAQAFSPNPHETALTLDCWWLQLKADTLVLQPAPPRTARSVA